MIDRLGEGREKVRDVAREVLVVMGGIALKTSATGSLIKAKEALSKAHQGQETNLAIFERLLRELGFSSKVWRVREQVCPYDMHIATLCNICISSRPLRW